MELSLPAGFRELQQASEELNQDHNVIGIVTDCMAPASTRGTDWQFTFSIQSNDLGSFGGGHRVKVFAPKDKMPPISGVNDVVVVNNIKSKDYRGSIIFLANLSTQFTVFPSKSMPQEQPGDGCKLDYLRCHRAKQAKLIPSETLMKYAWQLWDLQKYIVPEAPDAQSENVEGCVGKQGFKLIENVQAGGFYELLGQVVSLFDSNSGAVTMNFTDYTCHSLLHNFRPFGEAEGRDGDEFAYTSRFESQWKGPPGQFTISIDLWDSHAAWCRQNVKEKDYVRLNNVQITCAKDVGSKLEGKMRGDRKFPGKVNVFKASHSDMAPDEEVKELLQRKRDFIEQFGDWEKDNGRRGKKRKNRTEGSEDRASKRSAIERVEHQPLAELNVIRDSEGISREDQLSKQQKKRRKAKEKKRGQVVEQKAVVSSGEDGKENVAPDVRDDQRARIKEHKQDIEADDLVPKPRAQIRSEYNALNKNIATSHMDERLWSVPKIANHARNYAHRTAKGSTFHLPYQNYMYCADVRVVDFWPPDLRDFSRRERISEFDILRDDDSEPNPEPFEEDDCLSDDSSDGDEPSSTFSTLPPDTPPEPSSTFSTLPPDTSPERQEPRNGHRWIWDFYLLVEDRRQIELAKPDVPPSRIKLRVLGNDGSYLLKGLDACNLHKRKNERTLQALEEKLFILWGNLQEKKEEDEEQDPVSTGREALVARRPWMAGLTNRPFRCCVKEFGIRTRNVTMKKRKRENGGQKDNESVWKWKRQFAMFDTVIKS